MKFRVATIATNIAEQGKKRILQKERAKGTVILSGEGNGTGISEDVLYKRFQPFFATKPVAEKTGLGLSLSNDLITQSQWCKLKGDTIEGPRTTLTIILPV
jgi:C4-dicarboxylate-specific signal transduction histidine kinase